MKTNDDAGGTLSADGGPRPTDARSGDLLGDRYELVAELGRGAYGVVFRAYDRVAGTDVAIKVLGQARKLSSVAAERLRRELRAAWTVTHPGVVRIHDLILPGDQIALSMELVDGETLDVYLARVGRLEIPELLTLASELASALAAAHAAGVTHRDLKPTNIMIRSSGRAVITDLGLSRISGIAEAPGERSEVLLDSSDLTRTGELLGTPAFMAPEQLRGDADVGPAADIYALGLVLYQLATGERAHPHRTVRELMQQRFEQPPPPVASLRPDVPARLARVIDECLSIEVANRIPDGVDLVRRLDSLASPRRARWPWLVASLAVVGAAATIWYVRDTTGHALPGNRRVAFVIEGDRELDRALAHRAARLFTHDRRIRTVDRADANLVVHLGWHKQSDQYEVTAWLDAPERPIAYGKGTSLAQAQDVAQPTLAAVLDEGQPEGPLDERIRSAMVASGARDLESYREYADIIDTDTRTAVVDVPELEKRAEALIARDPTWAHPYALLMDMQGVFTPAATNTHYRALAAASRTRDPLGWLLLDQRGLDRKHDEARIAELDRAYASAPDDVLLAWYLYQVLLELHRDAEVLGVLRVIHERRPDLQFGSDLEQTLVYTGDAAQVPEIQRLWMERAPDSEQAWTAQIGADLATEHYADATRRAHELVALYGQSPQRLLTLANTSIVAGDLVSANTASNEMLRGNEYERVMGWFTLGEVEMLQGHFSGAREAWRAAAQRGAPLGTQGPTLHSLEELASLDEVTGDVADLTDTLHRLLDVYRSMGDRPRLEAHQITLDGLSTPRVCPTDIPAIVRTFPEEAGKGMFERALWRAAADVGCAPCSEVVRLGGSPDERSLRALYRLGVCAEAEKQLELARDTFLRARPLVTITENSSMDPSTVYSILSDFHLGRIYARLGQPESARKSYESFLARWGHPDRPIAEVDEARRALAALPH